MDGGDDEKSRDADSQLVDADGTRRNRPVPFTRNPMYLFGSTVHAGLALLLMQLWSFALLPAVFAATHYGVVLREESFLERKFGGRLQAISESGPSMAVMNVGAATVLACDSVP